MSVKRRVKKSKFNNIIVKKKDGVFDSKIEYSWWCTLKRMQDLGLIKDLQRQVKFVLIPAQYEEITDTESTLIKPSTKKKKVLKGKLLERECAYIADFVFTDCKTGAQIVCDAKTEATKTDIYIIKRKLMLFVHGIKIVELMEGE